MILSWGGWRTGRGHIYLRVRLNDPYRRRTVARRRQHGLKVAP